MASDVAIVSAFKYFGIELLYTFLAAAAINDTCVGGFQLCNDMINVTTVTSLLLVTVNTSRHWVGSRD